MGKSPERTGWGALSASDDGRSGGFPSREYGERAGEGPFEAAFDRSPIARALTAADGRLLRVNRAFCEMLGFTAAELQAGTWATITHPDDVAESGEGVRRALAGECGGFSIATSYVPRAGDVDV